MILVEDYAKGFRILHISAAALILYDDGFEKYSQFLRGFKFDQLQIYLIQVLNWVL